jgi:hypothetical protein
MNLISNLVTVATVPIMSVAIATGYQKVSRESGSSMARRRSGRVYLGQAQAPVAAMPEAAFFFGVETDAAGHMEDVYAGVVQGGGGQLTHAFVCPR